MTSEKTVFLAGASGAIGKRLVPLLVAQGWRVVGTTRSTSKCDLVRDLGARPVVVDVFDAAALSMAVVAARPDVVVHQLTDLPPGLDPAQMAAALPRNAKLRDIGTFNLVQAAVAAGARRFVAQSIAFAYAPGPTPHQETDPLATTADGDRGVTARGVARLEDQVGTGPFAGLVLRYGLLYGPGTGFDAAAAPGSVHVDAAAYAAALAVERGRPGIYNVAEDDTVVTTTKAKAELGWTADWRNPGQS